MLEKTIVPMLADAFRQRDAMVKSGASVALSMQKEWGRCCGRIETLQEVLDAEYSDAAPYIKEALKLSRMV